MCFLSAARHRVARNWLGDATAFSEACSHRETSCCTLKGRRQRAGHRHDAPAADVVAMVPIRDHEMAPRDLSQAERSVSELVERKSRVEAHYNCADTVVQLRVGGKKETMSIIKRVSFSNRESKAGYEIVRRTSTAWRSSPDDIEGTKLDSPPTNRIP